MTENSPIFLKHNSVLYVQSFILVIYSGHWSHHFPFNYALYYHNQNFNSTICYLIIISLWHISVSWTFKVFYESSPSQPLRAASLLLVAEPPYSWRHRERNCAATTGEMFPFLLDFSTWWTMISQTNICEHVWNFTLLTKPSLLCPSEFPSFHYQTPEYHR